MARIAMTLIDARAQATTNALMTNDVWFVITFMDGFTVTDLDGLGVRCGFRGGCTVVGVMEPTHIRAMEAAEAYAFVQDALS
jgi:hypothetical protein